MSPDEIIALIACAGICAFVWGQWFLAAVANRAFRPSPPAYLLPWLAAPLERP